MNLLPGDIVLIHRGTGWMIFAPFVWLWQWAVGPYHVEMVWDVIEDPFPTTTSTLGSAIIGYQAFSLQPPVLGIIARKLSDVKITVYRLKDRPKDMNWMFWSWGNEKILHVPYILGWSTCGHPPEEFYRDIVKEPCTDRPYPLPIERFCKKSDRFVRIV